jgi:hypothetical protein
MSIRPIFCTCNEIFEKNRNRHLCEYDMHKSIIRTEYVKTDAHSSEPITNYFQIMNAKPAIEVHRNEPTYKKHQNRK